jgi:hypothetical protein
MSYCVYAKEWGINELIFVDSYETLRDANACKRECETQHPEDSMGWPCRYLVRKGAPPEPGIPWEQLAAAGMENG